MKKGWFLAGCSTVLLASMMTQAQEAPQQSVSSQDTVQPITQEEIRQGLHDKDKKKAKEEQLARQKPKKLAHPEGQMNLLAEPEAPDEVEPVEALPPTPTSEIGSWDRCKCLACGKTVMGFSIAEHTQSEHQGKDPGYRKI